MISYFVQIIHIFTDSARGSQTFACHCVYIYIFKQSNILTLYSIKLYAFCANISMFCIKVTLIRFMIMIIILLIIIMRCLKKGVKEFKRKNISGLVSMKDHRVLLKVLWVPKTNLENTSLDKDSLFTMFVPEILHLDKNVSSCCVEIWVLPEGPVHMLCMRIHVSGAFNCWDCVSVHVKIHLKRNNTTPQCSEDITASFSHSMCLSVND